MEQKLKEAFDRVKKALDNGFGPDQRLIVEAGIKWVDLMLRKNIDYGNTAFNSPLFAPEMTAGAGIRVRMSDKISRLQTLLKGNKALVEESIDDTFRDLGVYCLLYLVEKERTNVNGSKESSKAKRSRSRHRPRANH